MNFWNNNGNCKFASVLNTKLEFKLTVCKAILNLIFRLFLNWRQNIQRFLNFSKFPNQFFLISFKVVDKVVQFNSPNTSQSTNNPFSSNKSVSKNDFNSQEFLHFSHYNWLSCAKAYKIHLKFILNAILSIFVQYNFFCMKIMRIFKAVDWHIEIITAFGQ